jgi:hypothetical protein
MEGKEECRKNEEWKKERQKERVNEGAEGPCHVYLKFNESLTLIALKMSY